MITEVDYCPLTGDRPEHREVIGYCCRCQKVVREHVCRNEYFALGQVFIVCYRCLLPEED